MRKFLLSLVAISGLLLSIGGLVIAGVVLMVLSVLFWPRNVKNGLPKKEQEEPLWESNDRQALYFEGDLRAPSDENSEF